MENILAISRIIILIGAVFFAFTAIFLGFYIILREYSLLSTLERIDKYTKLTNLADMQADIAKSTLSFDRTRPGLILVGIGAILLICCLFKPFNYEFSEEERRRLTPVPSILSKETPEIKKQEETKKELKQEEAQTKTNTAQTTTVNKDGGNKSRTKNTVNNQNIPPISIKAVDDITKLRHEILDMWLSKVNELKGKSLEKQQDYLRNIFGEQYVGIGRVIQDKQVTTEEIAEIAYDDKKYAPLIEAFNPESFNKEKIVGSYTRINTLVPLDVTSMEYFHKVSKKLSIIGGSKEQVYEDVLHSAEVIVDSEEYQKDPSAYWKKVQKTPFDFIDFYRERTGRACALQRYISEEGDTPELIARIKFGDKKFYKLLALFAPEQANLLLQPKKTIPTGTQFFIFQLSEF